MSHDIRFTSGLYLDYIWIIFLREREYVNESIWDERIYLMSSDIRTELWRELEVSVKLSWSHTKTREDILLLLNLYIEAEVT